MTAKWTPGPWIELEGGEVWASLDGDRVHPDADQPICVVQNATRCGDADARLIAAAPELAGALLSFLRAPSIGSSGPGSVTIEVQTFNLNAARAALKAAGYKDD